MSRPGYSIGIPVRPQSIIVPILFGSALAAFAARTIKVRMPQRGKIIGCTMNVGAKGGTHVTSTIDIQKTATTLLAALFDVAAATAGTPVDKEGSALAAAADDVAKDVELRVVLAEAGGTAPTVNDLTVQIDYIPLGD